MQPPPPPPPLKLQPPLTTTTGRYLAHPDGHTLKIWLESPEIGFPNKPDNYQCSEPKVRGQSARCLFVALMPVMQKVFPADCREAGTSYTAPLHCTVCSQCVRALRCCVMCCCCCCVTLPAAARYDDCPPLRVPKTITHIPIMVKSKRCNTCAPPSLIPLQFCVTLARPPPSATASLPPQTLLQATTPSPSPPHTATPFVTFFAAGEDRSEPGGYFIVHGLEKARASCASAATPSPSPTRSASACWC